MDNNTQNSSTIVPPTKAELQGGKGDKPRNHGGMRAGRVVETTGLFFPKDQRTK